MPLYEIFSHSDRFHYRAKLFSLATCFLIFCTAITFLPPFLFAYFAGGFWMKEGSYSEQPRVNYSSKYILIIGNTDTSTGTNTFFSSSYGSLNENFKNVIIPGTNTFAAIDTNQDGVYDQYSISIDLLFPSTSASITVSNVNVWLIFEYELRGREYIKMETMALINLFSFNGFTLSSNPNVTTEGELILEQRQPIQAAGSDLTYNVSIIDVNSLLSTSSINFNPVLDEYFTRKYYTTYQSQYEKWQSGTTSSTNQLSVNILVNIGTQSIRFIPGFWQEFKWGWIQYVSVLLPFIVVFNRIKEFVFRKQFVRTLVDVPYHRHKD
jgi:transmembrane protein 231